MFNFDVIVVGAGHAGVEAAVSAAKLGAKVLLTTINLDNIACDYSRLEQTQAFELIKMCCHLDNTLCLALDKRDPSIVLKYCMEMCKTANKYYTVCKILDNNLPQVKAKLQLLNLVKDVLSHAFKLICIETIDEM